MTTVKHIKYFEIFLNLLPSRLQREDSNKLLLVYCSTGGLELLNYTKFDKQFISNYLYKYLLKTGFRGSLVQAGAGKYDVATLESTYSALCCLLLIGEDYSKRIDRFGVCEYIRKLQVQDGSFWSFEDINGDPFGRGDLRQCYLAVAVLRMLGFEPKEVIDVDGLTEFIRSKQTFEGGLGDAEAHGGLTFCGMATLSLLGKLDVVNKEKMIDWLVHRQISYEYEDDTDIGGFNGRPNKYADTCYVYWCIATLKLLGAEHLVNTARAQDYLVNVTQKGLGGFGKTDVDDADPFHSFLGLSALSILGYGGLGELNSFDVEFCISSRATRFLRGLDFTTR